MVSCRFRSTNLLTEMPKEPLIPYHKVIRSLPGVFVIALAEAPDFTIAAASKGYSKASRLNSKELIGQNVLSALTRGAFQLRAAGVAQLKKAIAQACGTGRPVKMNDQPILIHKPNGANNVNELLYTIQVFPMADLKRKVTHLLISMSPPESVPDVTHKYHKLVDASPDAIVLIDDERKIVEMNQSAEEMFGYGKIELIGHEIEKLVPPRHRRVHRASHDAYFQQPSVRRMGSDLQLFAVRKDGTEFPVEVGLVPLFSGRSLQIGATIRDISERKKNEEHLKASERRYRLMFNENPYPTFICDLATHKFLEVNDSATIKFQYSHEEFGQLTTQDIFFSLPADRSKTTGPDSGLPQTFETGMYRAKKKDGEFRIIEIKSFYLDYGGRLARQITVNDVTEIVRLQEALVQHQQTMEYQIREAMFRAQEEEREHLGRELHDNVNQLLATARLFFVTRQEEDEHPDEILRKGIVNLDKAIAEIRQLALGLVIHEIMEAGLINSLKHLVETINLTKKVRIKLRTHLLGIEMTEDQQIAIYRIVQEQLSNILRHSHAKEVRIELTSKDHEITLRIIDDGKGFNAKEARKGIGITNIINRVKLFDGDVKIDTGPNRGCQLEVQMAAKMSKKLTKAK